MEYNIIFQRIFNDIPFLGYYRLEDIPYSDVICNTILTPKAGSPGHLWIYQTQHMCRRLANTHHTSCRTKTITHTSERGGGISCTRRTPARSISLTTRPLLLLVKCGRRVVCRLGSGTHRPLHAQHQPRDAPPCSDRDERPPRRLRARQRAARPTLARSISPRHTTCFCS